eukprot:6201205-Pleurochrysis_carterae.AAC.2
MRVDLDRQPASHGTCPNTCLRFLPRDGMATHVSMLRFKVRFNSARSLAHPFIANCLPPTQ